MTLRHLLAALVGCALLAAPGWGQTTLTPRFQEGATYKEKQTVHVKQRLVLNGQPLDTASNSTVVSQVKIGSRNEQGDLPIETTYTDIQSEVTLPGNKKVKYDSATDEGSVDDPNYQVILDALKASKGTTFTVVLDKDNQVKSVTGLNPASGASPEDVKLALQQQIKRYPSEPIQPGQEWERELVLPLGQGQIFTLTRKYKYVGPEVRSTVDSTRKLEKITAASENLKYSIRPNAGIPGTVTKSDLKVNSGQTTHLFDPQLGRTVYAEDKMHVTGALTLNIMNIELNGELDLTMDTRSEEVP